MRFAIIAALLSQVTCICASSSYHFPLYGVGGISSDSNKPITPIVTNSIIGQLYSGVVNSSVEYLYEYKYIDSSTGPVRMHVGSRNANTSHPLFSVVSRQHDVMSLQLPSEIGMWQYNVSSHTLCPNENYVHCSQLTSADNESVIVTIATNSEKNVDFSLQLEQVSDFWIDIGEERQALVSPAEPYYYQFKFPETSHTVLLKVTSDDNICMMVSLQDITCPIFDSDSNVRYAGFWQTMSSKSGMTVTKEKFPDGFYIVLIVLPDDARCTGSHETMTNPRTKNVTFIINEKLTTKQYLTAIFGIIGIFLTVFIVAVVIACCCVIIWKRHPIDTVIEENIPIAIPSTSQAQNPQNVNLEDADVEEDITLAHPTLFVADLARESPQYFVKKAEMYLWTIITISVFYALPVVQLVVTNQFILQNTGNLDLCYYNYLCSHPLGFLSDFNHIYSNIGYVLLGFLFMYLTWNKETTYRHRIKSDGRFDTDFGIPQHFGLFYSMGAAMVMEGIMSACYHVCPNHTNFQFDTSYMYIVGVISIIKLYQSRHPYINAGAYVAFGFLAFFIFMGVICEIYGTTTLWIIFTFLHIGFCIYLSAKIYYCGTWILDLGVFRRVYQRVNVWQNSPLLCIRPLRPCRMIFLLLGNLLNWSLAIHGVMKQPLDFASHLLSIVLCNLVYYTVFYIIMKFRHGERLTIQLLLYTMVSGIFWGFAIYQFAHNKCTTWELLPAQSREYNRECVLLGFYDNHDIWHFLSAFGMFFSFMMLLSLDDDLTFKHRSTIHVF